MRYLLIFALTLFLYGDTEFADPKPSMDNPRQIIFQINSGELLEINRALSSANNVIKFYGANNIELVIIAYHNGIKTLLKKESKLAQRVRSLMTYDVEFIACGNTMKSKKIDPKDLITDVEIVTAGIVEIVERHKQGWTNIVP